MQPSTSSAPMRRVKLLTMAPKKITGKNLNEKERELKNVTKLFEKAFGMV